MPAQRRDAGRIEWVTGERVITRGIDSLGEPQAHEKKLVGALAVREDVVGDEAVAVLLDAFQPGFRPFLGGGGVALAGDIEAAVRARPDAGIFVAAPVDEVVP